jgi:hypothetical protein
MRAVERRKSVAVMLQIGAKSTGTLADPRRHSWRRREHPAKAPVASS